MKNYDKLSDNEHKIDLISLNEFLINKGDVYLKYLIDTSRFVKKESITKEFFQANYRHHIFNSNSLNDLGFNGNDFPVEYYTDEIVNNIEGYIQHDIKYLLRLNSNIKNYYSICKEAIKRNPYALIYIHKNVIDYELCELAVSKDYHVLRDVPNKFKDYNLCKKAFANSDGSIISYNWFPKEYIPQLKKDFPFANVFKNFIQENKKHYLKENNNMTKKDLLIEFIKKEIVSYLNEAKKSKKKVGPTGKKIIKRKDGSESEEGLWDNIRKNKGSGKKPTPAMKAQEKKIKKDEK